MGNIATAERERERGRSESGSIATVRCESICVYEYMPRVSKV